MTRRGVNHSSGAFLSLKSNEGVERNRINLRVSSHTIVGCSLLSIIKNVYEMDNRRKIPCNILWGLNSGEGCE